jgi:hypothetical protein
MLTARYLDSRLRMGWTNDLLMPAGQELKGHRACFALAILGLSAFASQLKGCPRLPSRDVRLQARLRATLFKVGTSLCRSVPEDSGARG